MPIVKLYFSLRKLVGMNKGRITGSNLRMVLDCLSREYPQLVDALAPGDRLRPQVVVIVNGSTIDVEKEKDVPRSERDRIGIFSPLGGGV
jgi:sulfur carrier protein ThiS